MPKHILIVEDNALVVEIYRSALKQLDVVLVEARNGDEAMRLAAATTPDLVIMDILLPGADGYDVLKRLRTLPALAHTPVLAVTNAAAAGEADMIKRAGFEALIPKPINVQSFVAEVRRLTA